MKSAFIKKLAAIMLIILLTGGLFTSCTCSGKQPVPSNTERPDATEQSAAAGSDEPLNTETVPSGPDSSEDADNTEIVDDSNEPSFTEPYSSQAPDNTSASEQPVYPTGNQGSATPTPAPTGSGSATPSPTQPNNTNHPVQTATPNPTSTPRPDPVTVLTELKLNEPVYCDMDFDGNPEKVEISSKKRDEGKMLLTVKVTVGSSGSVLVDSFTTDTYLNGYLNNFNSGDKRVELIVSSRIGKRNDTIKSYRLNQASSGLLSCINEGRIESIQGNTITVARYVDLMGTWECTSVHTFDYSSFELTSIDGEWYVKSEPNRWCTVARELFVTYYSTGADNEFGYLYPAPGGDIIRPTSTDLSSRIDFVTDTNASGYITVSFDQNCVPYFDGELLSSYFTDLNYIN